MNEEYYIANDNSKVSLRGLLTKSIIFLLIVMLTMTYTVMNFPGFLLKWVGLVIICIMKIYQTKIHEKISKLENRDSSGWILSTINALISGFFLGYFLGLFIIISNDLIRSVLILVLIACIVATIGSIAILPILKKKKFEFSNKFKNAIVIAILGYLIMYVSLLVLSPINPLLIYLISSVPIPTGGYINILIILIFTTIVSLAYVDVIKKVSDSIGVQEKSKEFLVSLEYFKFIFQLPALPLWIILTISAYTIIT